ncbi:MAG TPA: tetratricopeptide repeat protein [Streptosporangiaceae bacterium]|nr:tetratricopeptide repeat protein [Streptosporangiaceae bacterium]
MTAVGTSSGLAAQACTRPGCNGTIEDGYCDVCGLAPLVPAQPSAPAASGGVSTSTGLTTTGTGASGPSSRRTRSGASRSSRGRLGAGLVEIDPVPARDPATAIMAHPQVPESKRFCGNCGQAVGRSRGGRPGLTEGFCPHCGTQFSFSAKLASGDLVAGQYEVLGCLAHGGLGWIYLARDHHLSDRWVVLKGLLNSGDSSAQEAAVAERRFLAEVEHPTIVGIYNFVQHPDKVTGALTGYIVMEYVGGRSLRQILLDHRATTGQSLPVSVALAYAIEVLPALGYLHNRGLVYCDFKPENVIQTEEQLKLIDMGAVRRIDDEGSPIYGTAGYQAPEIAALGPSPSSDLYTVGRALAVLTFEFAGYQTQYEHSLPDPATVPALAQHESFLRAVRRATNADPDQRFASASEMAEQLTGVLREVLAVADGQQRPAFSTLFSAEVQAIGVPGHDPADRTASYAAPPVADVVAGLPVPVVDSSDPAAGFLATLSPLEPAQRITALTAAVAGEQGTPAEVAESLETRLALARALIVGERLADAAAVLADAASRDPADWRVTWYQGLHSLAHGDHRAARAAFDEVVETLPGELAPKLALGLAAEAAADFPAAARYFQVVWTVDRSYVSAGFGLARIRRRDGDKTGAVDALSGVPQSSSQYTAAQVAALRMRLLPATGQQWVSADDLHEASRQMSGLHLDPAVQQRLTTEVLLAGLARIVAGQPLDGAPLLGVEPNERAVRSGLERSYRTQARQAPDAARRVALVDMANEIRPRTWS